jgi:hypothetical protein
LLHLRQKLASWTPIPVIHRCTAPLSHLRSRRRSTKTDNTPSAAKSPPSLAHRLAWAHSSPQKNQSKFSAQASTAPRTFSSLLSALFDGHRCTAVLVRRCKLLETSFLLSNCSPKLSEEMTSYSLDRVSLELLSDYLGAKMHGSIDTVHLHTSSYIATAAVCSSWSV